MRLVLLALLLALPTFAEDQAAALPEPTPSPYDLELRAILKGTGDAGTLKALREADAAKKEALKAQRLAKKAHDDMKALIVAEEKKDELEQDAEKLRKWKSELGTFLTTLTEADAKLAAARTKLAEETSKRDKALDDKSGDNKQAVTDLKTELAKLRLLNEYDDVNIKGLAAENKLAALVARLDGTILANYMANKMERLISSEQFCKRANECGKDAAAKPTNAPLKELFDRKTHGSGK